MIDLTKQVKTALQSACPRIYAVYPNTFTETPVVSFYEASNSSADATDLLTPIAFQVDVWASKQKDGTGVLKTTAAAVDTAMRGLGFRRAMSAEVPDPSEYKQQSMRFEGIYNALDQKIYSRS